MRIKPYYNTHHSHLVMIKSSGYIYKADRFGKLLHIHTYTSPFARAQQLVGVSVNRYNERFLLLPRALKNIFYFLPIIK